MPLIRIIHCEGRQCKTTAQPADVTNTSFSESITNGRFYRKDKVSKEKLYYLTEPGLSGFDLYAINLTIRIPIDVDEHRYIPTFLFIRLREA